MKRRGKTTTMAALLLLSVITILYAAMTVAQPTGPDSINVNRSERANLTQIAQTVEAQAGNVTELVIDATAITEAWQGYFGNITGTLTLEDANQNVFYNWSGLNSISGEVYASRDGAVDWGTANCSNSSEFDSENSFLGKVNTDPDSVNNTFTQKNHPSFLVGTTNITENSCYSTNAYVNSASQTTNFYQVLLADGDGDIVYTTLIDEDTTGFNGQAYDFQLLVGENGNESSSGSTTYNFYIELS